MTRANDLNQSEPLRLLERAARAAGTPLSVHRSDADGGESLEAGWGGCGVCRFVSRIEGGAAACGASRTESARLALRQGRVLAFTCHMGLTCVSAPLAGEPSRVLTFGPFYPDDEGRALESDVARGLRQLGAGHVVPPLADIRPAPPSAIRATAEWTLESLAALETHVAEAGEVEQSSFGPTVASRPSTDGAALRKDLYDGATIAALIAGGNQPEARELLRTVLEEGQSRTKTWREERQARVVAAVAASLENLARTGHARTAWDRFPAFIEAVGDAKDDAGLLDAAMLVLGAVRRTARPRAREGTAASIRQVGDSMPGLNDLLTRRMEGTVTLEEVARELGETPSAISHRLKKKFGMSFSEYRGRLRIDKAKDLLRRTQLSATEVARRVGIPDQSNFGKLFRKFEGMSPIEYRRQHGRS